MFVGNKHDTEKENLGHSSFLTAWFPDFQKPVGAINVKFGLKKSSVRNTTLNFEKEKKKLKLLLKVNSG